MTKTSDRVDIDFGTVSQRGKIDRIRNRTLLENPQNLRAGLIRYLQVSDHYLALNSRTPSQPSGAPSSSNW